MPKESPANIANDLPEEEETFTSSNGIGAKGGIEAPALAANESDMDTLPDGGGENPTGPLDTEDSSVPRNTTPLRDSLLPPAPPLAAKEIAGARYRIVTLLGSPHGTNVYRVTDTQGYRQCWACGSSASVEGDVYCVECGAQLTDRYYRLQEWNASQLGGAQVELRAVSVADDSNEEIAGDAQPSETHLATLPLPEAILENAVPGVARVYDTFVDTEAARAYVVWEEVYGRALASWLPDAGAADTMTAIAPPATSGQLLNMDTPGEEQALAWMAQAADVLTALHSQGIVNCKIELTNLIVQPGDRLVLLDPTGAYTTQDGDGGTEPLSEKASDLRNLAIELERWYLAIRQDTFQASSELQVEDPALNSQSSPVAAVDEITGPLSNPASPAVLLTKAREGVYESAEEFAQALYDLYDASRPITNVQLWSGRSTDVGQVRQINEDSVLTLEANVLEHEGILPVGLYVVADGMGGHQSGEVASSIAARTIGAMVNTSLIAPLVAGDPVACDATTCAYLLQQAVVEANRRIADLAQERHSDLGTTVTTALIVGNQLTVANVGDSRTYMWRDGHLAVITKDHSLVAQLVAAGQITAEEVYTHPRRNEIYRALGDPHLTNAEVDTFSYVLQPGDGVLLCSDGLWDFVRDPIINALLDNMAEEDPQLICRSLVDRANSMGGEDNISTIFVRIVPPASSEQ